MAAAGINYIYNSKPVYKENYTVTKMSQILFQNNCKEWT
jgi:hypothetical protein